MEAIIDFAAALLLLLGFVGCFLFLMYALFATVINLGAVVEDWVYRNR